MAKYSWQLCPLLRDFTLLFINLPSINKSFVWNHIAKFLKMQEQFLQFPDLNSGPLDLDRNDFPLDYDTHDNLLTYLKIYTWLDMRHKEVVLYFLF